MKVGVYQQGWQFLCTVLLGMIIGSVYDLLWGLRSRFPRLTWMTDLIIGLSVLIGNWLLFLYVGNGEYRIFFIPGIGLRFLLWKKLFSRCFRQGILWFWRLIFLPFAVFGVFLKKIIKKTEKFLKNLFSNREKSVTINNTQIINGGELGE